MEAEIKQIDTRAEASMSLTSSLPCFLVVCHHLNIFRHFYYMSFLSIENGMYFTYVYNLLALEQTAGTKY
jgi:hypothetical protein